MTTTACTPLVAGGAGAIVAGGGAVVTGGHLVASTDHRDCVGSMSCAFDILVGASLVLVGVALIAGGGIALGVATLE